MYLIVALVTESSTSPPPTDPSDKEPGNSVVITCNSCSCCMMFTCFITVGFVMTPLPVNKTVKQQMAVFHCQHSSSDDITWSVNGTSFHNSPNISVVKVPLSGGGFRSSLSVATLPDFSETSVQCVAIFYQGTPFQFTPPVTLLIQGVDIRQVFVQILNLLWTCRYSWKHPQP